MLFLFKGTEKAFEEQLSILSLPPILRLLYTISLMANSLRNDTGGIIKEIIELYNDSLKILSDEELRTYVKKGLPDREAVYMCI